MTCSTCCILWIMNGRTTLAEKGLEGVRGTAAKRELLNRPVTLERQTRGSV